LLLAWFKQTPAIELPHHVTQETVVMVMSWAIFGVCFQWTHEELTLSSEELAKQVTTLLMAGF
jgi:hypothetical protein